MDAAACFWNNQRTLSSRSEWPRMNDLNLSSAIAERTQYDETMHTRLSDGLRLERIAPEHNMARYCTLAVELTLFAD